jgi:hypothetical protein
MNEDTRFPVAHLGRAVAFETEEVQIDGMRVLFDKRVTLFPVMLDELATAIAREKKHA